jgi:RHS repeat-associated protein
LFTGRYYDAETGLYYYRARVYNPYIGRFMQTDPSGYSGGINLYAYCGNNPIMLVDPYGLCGGSGWFGNAVSSANRIYGEISDAPQQIGRGLSDGVYLAGNGASLGLLGDDAQLSSLQKEYGGWATASRVLSGTSTVLATAGGGMEYLGARGLIAAGTEVASNPLSGTYYGQNVLAHLENTADIYHNFPRIIDSLAKYEDIGTIPGGDGINRTTVTMPGTINKVDGFYTYIMENSGEITHRFFDPH